MRLPLLSAAAAVSVLAFAAPAFATTGCNAVGGEALWFSDVGGCHSYYPSITYVRDEGIVEGYPDKTFKPDQPINRAEFVKILVGARFGGTDCYRGSTFRDVKNTDWFNVSVCVAEGEGWIDGYPDGTFKPGNLINYAEAAKIAANAYGLEIDENAGGEWGDQDSWFLPYSLALLGKHAVPPTVDGYASLLTRGEMAEMIYRLETGKTSFAWLKDLPDGDMVPVYSIPGSNDVEFSYPGSVFVSEPATMRIPDAFVDGKEHVVPSIRLAYVRADESEQGCDGMSGMLEFCRPSKSDLVIDVGVVGRPMEYLRLGMAGIDNENAPDVDGRPAAGFWQGIECEGVKYVFVPLDATRSLVIKRTYDCTTNVDVERQEELFSSFLGTVRFLSPYVSQNAPTMDVSVLLCRNDGQPSDGAEAPTIKVNRTVPKSSAVADMTLRSLFSNDWMQTPEGSRDCAGIYWMERNYRGVTIANGVATVKLAASFDSWRAADEYAANEGYVESAQASVSANLKQFPSVKDVRYVVQP